MPNTLLSVPVGRQTAATGGLLQLLPKDPEGDLYHQPRRVVELLAALAGENPWSFSQR